jgi:16S rRNA (guanine527-N7)-methyltransferase
VSQIISLEDRLLSRAKELELYEGLLRRWQKTLNLVSSSTLDVFLERHVKDSAQLLPFLNSSESIGDMGAGAGFPGLVLALLGDFSVHLIESDTRKCLFLEEVIRHTKASAVVHCCRLEAYQGPSLNTWVGRAFAPLEKILYFARHHLTPATRFVLLKGKSAETEVKNALKKWQFRVEFYPSLTHPEGQVLILTQVSFRR